MCVVLSDDCLQVDCHCNNRWHIFQGRGWYVLGAIHNYLKFAPAHLFRIETLSPLLLTASVRYQLDLIIMFIYVHLFVNFMYISILKSILPIYRLCTKVLNTTSCNFLRETGDENFTRSEVEQLTNFEIDSQDGPLMRLLIRNSSRALKWQRKMLKSSFISQY